jgi:hypothetical protein
VLDTRRSHGLQTYLNLTINFTGSRSKISVSTSSRPAIFSADVIFSLEIFLVLTCLSMSDTVDWLVKNVSWLGNKGGEIKGTGWERRKCRGNNKPTRCGAIPLRFHAGWIVLASCKNLIGHIIQDGFYLSLKDMEIDMKI